MYLKTIISLKPFDSFVNSFRIIRPCISRKLNLNVFRSHYLVFFQALKIRYWGLFMDFNNLIFPLFYNLLAIMKISLLLHLTNSCKTCVSFHSGKLEVHVTCDSGWGYKRSSAEIVHGLYSPSHYSSIVWFTRKDDLKEGSSLIPLWVVQILSAPCLLLYFCHQLNELPLHWK